MQLVQLGTKQALDAYLDGNQLQGKVNYLYGNTNAGRFYVVLYAADFSGHEVAQQGVQGVLSPGVIEGARIRSYGSLQQNYTKVSVH
ncbi:MAG: hypothetical protein V7731_00070 [Amphritea sp.]